MQILLTFALVRLVDAVDRTHEHGEGYFRWNS
jgi:hypothetical protein